MSNQIKNMVDNGIILNYDACFQDLNIIKLAKQNPVPNDNVNISQSIDKLCRPYYNHPFWRGSINSNLDDRLSNGFSSIINKTQLEQSQQAVNDISGNFFNQVNQVKQLIISFNINGQESDENSIQTIKQNIQASIKKITAERKKLEQILNDINNQNGDTVLQQVAENEEKLRRLENENIQFRKAGELRKVQAKDLYGRYNSNFHSSFFGYGPMQSSNQSAMIFTSFLIGFIGLIAGGIQIVHLIPYPDLSFLKESSIPKINPPLKKLNSRY